MSRNSVSLIRLRGKHLVDSADTTQTAQHYTKCLTADTEILAIRRPTATPTPALMPVKQPFVGNLSRTARRTLHKHNDTHRQSGQRCHAQHELATGQTSGIIQFSTRSPGTRRNSDSLFVTRETSAASACAAIIVSSAPMRMPRRSSNALTGP